MHRAKRSFVSLAVVAALAFPAPSSAAELPEAFDFVTPVFNLSAGPDGGLFAADAGAGIVEIRNGSSNLVAELPGVTDVAAVGRGAMFAITGGGPETPPETSKLYRVSRGQVSLMADLWQFEATVNPDGSDIVDTNPYGVAALTGDRALVADAGGNVLLDVDGRGNVDWVALFPDELVSTANLQALAGCPTPPPGLEFACALPPMMPAEPVPTSIAIGPDGAWYVGELKGFPAPTGESRIWRIEPGTRHADCATSPACSVVADGFTSIVDLSFGPDGTLYVTELDESSWFALEFGAATSGGSVSACSPGGWTCSVVATGLPMPMASTLAGGTLYTVLLGVVPGAATVVPLP